MCYSRWGPRDAQQACLGHCSAVFWPMACRMSCCVAGIVSIACFGDAMFSFKKELHSAAHALSGPPGASWCLAAALAVLLVATGALQLTCECAVQNDSLATLLARLEGILGPVPQRLLAQGRYTHRYYTVSGALFERNPRTVSAHLPSPCSRGKKDC